MEGDVLGTCGSDILPSSPIWLTSDYDFATLNSHINDRMRIRLILDCLAASAGSYWLTGPLVTGPLPASVSDLPISPGRTPISLFGDKKKEKKFVLFFLFTFLTIRSFRPPLYWSSWDREARSEQGWLEDGKVPASHPLYCQLYYSGPANPHVNCKCEKLNSSFEGLKKRDTLLNSSMREL